MVHAASPSRVYAILAREAPMGVVFRRGPSKWVQTLRWNLTDDTFEPGQWFHGRIYERRADLSPNGRYLVYFASKQQNYGRMHKLIANERMTWEEAQNAVLVNWTAVSRPPYLTALALWPQDSTYDGGGLFESSNWLLIDDFFSTPPQFPCPPNRVPHDFKIVANLSCPEDYKMIEEIRLDRNGWAVQTSPVELPANTDYGSLYQGQSLPQQRVKSLPGTNGIAMIWAVLGHSRSNSLEIRQRYGLINAGQKPFFWLPAETEWADWDAERGRLVWAFEGKLWALPFLIGESVDLGKAKMLIDLNPNKPEAIVAPDWAHRW